jgi:hypothetical protein
LLDLFQSLKVKVTLTDQRFTGTPVELQFHGSYLKTHGTVYSRSK